VVKADVTEDLHRILLALDAASLSKSAFEAAVELAARLDAELHGLFVEDEELLRLAELPFVRHYNISTATGRALDVEGTERELAVLAGQARRSFAAAAARTKVRHSFEVVRGTMSAVLAAAATGIDLVIVQGSCRPLARHMRMGAPGRNVAFELDRPVLLLEPEAALPDTVFAVYDDGDAGNKALRLAARLVGRALGTLHVVLPAEDGEEREKCEAAARKALARAGTPLVVDSVAPEELGAVRGRIPGARWALIVMSLDSPHLAGAKREHLIEALGCPLLLVQ
jgi:hypothetical protein